MPRCSRRSSAAWGLRPERAAVAGKVIDARDLLPPEPLELTLSALDDLGADDELVLLLYREPHPLYSILRDNGFCHRTESRADGTFEIRIRRAS